MQKVTAKVEYDDSPHYDGGGWILFFDKGFEDCQQCRETGKSTWQDSETGWCNMMDINDPDFMPLWKDMEKSLEVAWQAALRVCGCVECARLELVQRLRGMAGEKNTDIIGIDWLNENSMKEDQSAEPPMEKDGIRRICEQCQNPPPEGSIQFFKHGTDELI